MSTGPAQRVRCAIYTRKSSEEGLEQSFNSLDAQREACAAYILSQASEGWTAVPDIYDDGGLSGGTLERPALQRLLADVAAGNIDIIVVYKVDRLTRSLLDFSRLVEAFDKAGTSFVSVTQSFNTTTSMGRLTLNMLLSFAQFEREVTAERIRDKIAASKARGMWMGGTPPLGYKPDGRSLAIVEEHAALTQRIFTRYLELGNVSLLAEALIREGTRSPVRTTKAGRAIGGVPFSRGQLYLMLKCRTFLGEIAHKDQVYPGLHPAIIDRELWDQVQARLTDNLQGARTRRHAAKPSLLAGLIKDEAGAPLIATHASKGKVRYRYYVSRALHEGIGGDGLRLPAREIEQLVAERLAALFEDPLDVVTTAGLELVTEDYSNLARRAKELAGRLVQRERVLVRELVQRVTVERGRVGVTCSSSAIAAGMRLPLAEGAPPSITLTSDVRLTRSGMAMKLVQPGGGTVGGTPDRSLVRAVAQAHRYWAELRAGVIDVTRLAEREKVSPAWITRTVRLAFLSPEVVEAIMAGKQRAGVTTATLLATDSVDHCWADQRQRVLPAR